jgi:hypothetical protein
MNGGFYRVSYAKSPEALVKQVAYVSHFIMWYLPEAFQTEVRAFPDARLASACGSSA